MLNRAKCLFMQISMGSSMITSRGPLQFFHRCASQQPQDHRTATLADCRQIIDKTRIDVWGSVRLYFHFNTSNNTRSRTLGLLSLSFCSALTPAQVGFELYEALEGRIDRICH